MSLPWEISGRISVLAPVSTITEAVAAAAAGASLVDVGDDDELIPAIRHAARDVSIIGRGAGADITRDAARAARAGAGLISPDPDAAARAVANGISAERILLAAAPAGLPAVVRAGWAVLVDVDGGAAEAKGPAEAEAVAAVCGWLGASVIRTRYVAGVRRSLDMTESILGRRPPAWALRGLA
jgi:hypothetical protein